MPKIIYLEKHNHLLNEMQIYHICNICKVLYQDKLVAHSKSICRSCFTRLDKILNSEVFIFNFKSKLYNVVQLKNNNISFFDFKKAEKLLIEITERNNAFFYCPETLQWYITYDYKNYNLIAKTLVELNKIFQGMFSFGKNQNINDIANPIETKLRDFFKNYYIQSSSKVFNPYSESPQTDVNQVHLHLNRKIIYEKLNQSFDFFN